MQLSLVEALPHICLTGRLTPGAILNKRVASSSQRVGTPHLVTLAVATGILTLRKVRTIDKTLDARPLFDRLWWGFLLCLPVHHGVPTFRSRQTCHIACCSNLYRTTKNVGQGVRQLHTDETDPQGCKRKDKQTKRGEIQCRIRNVTQRGCTMRDGCGCKREYK